MRLVLLVLAASVAIGIAFLWSASVATQSAGSTPTNERALGESTAHELVASPAPPERELVSPVAASPAATPIEAHEPRPEPTPVQADARPELPSATAVLEVVVVARETGAPIAGTSVQFSSIGRGIADDESWSGLGLVTDANGSAFGAVPADTPLRIMVMGSSAIWEMVGPLAPGEHRRIDIGVVTAETLRVVVRVLAAENDAPIAGARVALEESLGTFTTGLDGETSFEIEAAVPCDALVDADGFATRSVQVAGWESGGDATVTVRLLRSAALVVHVLDERGGGREGLSVILTAPSHSIRDGSMNIFDTADLRWEESTAADGTCRFGSLPPEVPFTLEIKRRRKLLRREAKPVSLAAGELRSIEIHVGAGITITGRLLDQDGEPVVGHDVLLLAARDGALQPFHASERESAMAVTRTKDVGEFTLRDVAPGSWWIGPGGRTIDELSSEFDANWVAGIPAVVDVAPGDPDREVELRGHRGLFIEGRVVDPDGEPVKGVYVVAGYASDPSDHDGAFRIGPLLPRAHDLSAGSFSTGWAPPAPKTVEAGATGVVIELLRGGSVLARVRDASGGQVSARIRLSRGERFMGMSEGSGSAQFRGLLPGAYALVASTSDGCAVVRDVMVEVGRVTEVELALAPAARLTVLYAGKSANGHVDVWSGDTVVASDNLATGTSHPCSVPPGPLRVVMKSDGASEERTVEALSGELTKVAFE